MPLCYVNFDRSPTYRTLIQKLKKEFPHVEEDIAGILPDVAMDHRNAHKAESVPRFHDTLFKYRAPCSDQNRGSRGGFRVCGYYHAPQNTLFLILVWPKSHSSDLDYETMRKAVKELLEIIEQDP